MESTDYTYRCLCGGGMHCDPFLAGRITKCPRCSDIILVPAVIGELAVKPSFQISTTRLCLDIAQRKDWREIHEVSLCDENYAFEISIPPTLQETKATVKKASFPAGFKKSNELLYKVMSRDESALLGTITVHFAIPYYCVYLGIMMKKEEQGKGYGTEAIAAVTNYLTAGFKVERVVAMCDTKNEPCRSMLENVGFKLEGIAQRFMNHHDRGWIDIATYALIRGEGKAGSAGGGLMRPGLKRN